MPEWAHRPTEIRVSSARSTCRLSRTCRGTSNGRLAAMDHKVTGAVINAIRGIGRERQHPDFRKR